MTKYGMRNYQLMHTRYFQSLQDVERVFGTTITRDEQEAITIYIVKGIRPDPGGCWTCNAAAMRRLTGYMDRYEDAVDAGKARFGALSSEVGLPYGGDWG